MRLRRLSVGEVRLAAEVFGAALDPRRVWLLTGAPTGGWAMVLFGLMLFPGELADFAAEPVPTQAWFVHELTHAWQFQTRPLWTLASWARVALSGCYLNRRAYRYTLPVAWDRLNLEQQAKVVEHRFLLERGLRPADMPAGAAIEAYHNLNLREAPEPVRG